MEIDNTTIANIKVSVIIPCYNVEECINRAVDSVLNQTHKNIEVICVDNNSTDKTAEIINSLAAKHNNFSAYSQSIKGPCPTRNLGFSKATGSWIQFLDADDYIEPEKIEYQLSVADQNNLLREEALVVGQKIWRRTNGEDVQNKLSEDKWKDMIHGRLGDTCANLWSSSIVKKVGGWNENLPSSTEVDLQFRMLINGAKIAYDKKPLTIIFERDSGSISKENPIQNYVRVVKQRLEIKKYLLKNEGLHKYVDFINFFIFNNLKLIYNKDKGEFDKLMPEVKEGGFDLTKSEYLGTLSKFLMRVLGLKAYLKVTSFKSN
jgi:glycosyltransferase involved in cell wall biosynthesis